MVSGRAVVGIYRGAGGERDCAGGSGGKEGSRKERSRKERSRQKRREGREKRGRSEAGGSTDLDDFSGGRRGLAIDTAGDGYRRISLVERRETDCVYSGEPGKQEGERAEGKIQRLRSVRGRFPAEPTVGS